MSELEPYFITIPMLFYCELYIIFKSRNIYIYIILEFRWNSDTFEWNCDESTPSKMECLKFWHSFENGVPIFFFLLSVCIDVGYFLVWSCWYNLKSVSSEGYLHSTWLAITMYVTIDVKRELPLLWMSRLQTIHSTTLEYYADKFSFGTAT